MDRKSAISLLKFALVLLAVTWALLTPAHAQSPVAGFIGQQLKSLDTASSTGPGTVFSLQPSTYSYTWTIAPTGSITTATVNLEGSLDGTTWYVLDVASTTDGYWSNGEMRHVVNKPANYLRANLTAISGGGSITAVISLYK